METERTGAGAATRLFIRLTSLQVMPTEGGVSDARGQAVGKIVFFPLALDAGQMFTILDCANAENPNALPRSVLFVGGAQFNIVETAPEILRLLRETLPGGVRVVQIAERPPDNGTACRGPRLVT